MAGDYTHLLVGAGLHNGLTALALRRHQPDARVALLERGPRPGGDHTWCYHGDDPDDPCHALVLPLCAFRWPTQEVRFPDFERTLSSAYAGFTSAELAHALEQAFADWPGSDLLVKAEVVDVAPHAVTLADGQRLTGELVIDARGPSALAIPPDSLGYQKFYGLDLVLEAPHGMVRPLLMDATLPQQDGFRFLYVLPLGQDRLLVEDTRFSPTPELDLPRLRAGLLAEVSRRGWRVARELRDEHAILPMPWAGTIDTPSASPVRAGYAGGWLHPVTGYSLPVAARFALAVAAGPRDTTLVRLQALQKGLAQRLPFLHRLNRLLFQCFEPQDMWNVFTRFYRKPEPLIERFYALGTTSMDRTRILLGRPPKGVKLARALAILR